MNHLKLCIINKILQWSSPFICLLLLSNVTPIPLGIGLGKILNLSRIVSSISFIESLTELESVGGIGDDGGGGDVMITYFFLTIVEEDILSLELVL